MVTFDDVIRTFKSKGLAELWGTGKTARIDVRMHRRIMLRLERLELATTPDQLNTPGFNFHPLQGFKPRRYSMLVNGPWCITFEFENGEAHAIDFEQYH